MNGGRYIVPMANHSLRTLLSSSLQQLFISSEYDDACVSTHKILLYLSFCLNNIDLNNANYATNIMSKFMFLFLKHEYETKKDFR